MSTYINGQQVRLTATFTVAGTATDPTAITFQAKNPAGTVTTYTYGVDSQLVKQAVGIYYVDWTFSVDGAWNYRFAATGTVTAASEADIFIKSAFV